MNYSPSSFRALVSPDPPCHVALAAQKAISQFADPELQVPLHPRSVTTLEYKPRRRQTFFQALPFLAFALLIAGGRFSAASAQNAPSPDTKGNLVLFDFGDANDKQIRDAAIARFKKRYPNVKVTDQFTPISSWSDYLNKLVTQIASGKAPDLIHIATEGVQLAVRKNLVISLDELTSEPSGKDLLSDVDPALVKGFSVEGKLYLLPVAWNNMMIYYNTKVFKDAGIARPADDWTWDDFLSIAKRLTSGEGPAKRFGFGIPYFNFGLTPFRYSNDTAVLKDDLKQSNLSDTKFLEALKFVHSLVRDNGVSPDPANTDPNAVFQLFAAGKIAMTDGGHWPMQACRRAMQGWKAGSREVKNLRNLAAEAIGQRTTPRNAARKSLLNRTAAGCFLNT